MLFLLAMSPPAAKPVPVRLWRVEEPKKMSLLVDGEDFVLGQDNQGPFRLDARTGERAYLDASRPDARFDKLGMAVVDGKWTYAAALPVASVHVRGKAARVLWDTPKRKLAVTEPDDKGSTTLYDLRPGTAEPLASARVPFGPITYVYGNADAGTFLVSWSNVTERSAKVVSAAFGTKLKPLPCPTFIYSVDDRGILGAKNDGGQDSYGTPNSYPSALSLSDLKTGKARWTNKNYNTGRWWNGYILASYGRTTWAVLDPKTGSVANSDLGGVSGSLWDARVVGDVLITRKTSVRPPVTEGWELARGN